MPLEGRYRGSTIGVACHVAANRKHGSGVEFGPTVSPSAIGGDTHFVHKVCTTRPYPVMYSAVFINPPYPLNIKTGQMASLDITALPQGCYCQYQRQNCGYLVEHHPALHQCFFTSDPRTGSNCSPSHVSPTPPPVSASTRIQPSGGVKLPSVS